MNDDLFDAVCEVEALCWICQKHAPIEELNYCTECEMYSCDSDLCKGSCHCDINDSLIDE